MYVARVSQRGSRKAQAAPSDALSEYNGQLQTNKAPHIEDVFDFQLTTASLQKFRL